MSDLGTQAHGRTGRDPFRVDPDEPQRRLWRQSRLPARLTGLIAAEAAMLALMTALGALLLARAARQGGEVWPAACLALASLGLGLTSVLLALRRRHLRGNAIVLGPSAITLRLAGADGLIHRLAEAQMRLPYAELTALESRVERGGWSRKRVYRLLRRDGSRLFLFEERGVGTRLAGPSLRPVAEAIAAGAGIPLIGETGAASGQEVDRSVESLGLVLGVAVLALTVLLWLDLLARLSVA